MTIYGDENQRQVGDPGGRNGSGADSCPVCKSKIVVTSPGEVVIKNAILRVDAPSGRVTAKCSRCKACVDVPLQSEVRQFAEKVQDVDHGLPRLVLLPGDQRRRPHRAPPSGHGRGRVLPAHRRRLSTDPHLGVRLNAFIRWDQVLPVIGAASEIFRDSDVLRENREKARLKFLSAIEDRLGLRLWPAADEEPPDDVYRDHVGVHPRKGKKMKVDGRTVDAYYFCLGGAVGRHGAPARPVGFRTPASDVPAAIERILRGYLATRVDDENFRQFCARHRDEDLRALLAGGMVAAVDRDSAPGPVPHGLDG